MKKTTWGKKSLCDLGHSTLREAKAGTIAEAVRNATHFLACSCLAVSSLLYTLGSRSQGTLFTVSWDLDHESKKSSTDLPIGQSEAAIPQLTFLLLIHV